MVPKEPKEGGVKNQSKLMCGEEIEIKIKDRFVCVMRDGFVTSPYTVERIEGDWVHWEEGSSSSIDLIRNGKNGSYFRRSRSLEDRKTSIIQNWVSELGLRHQGVIVSAVRGCDTLPKEAAAKTLSRFFRGCVLNAHCGSVKGAKTYMAEPTDEIEFQRVAARFFQEWDALPFHYVIHFVHATEIVGYYREDWLGVLWKDFYLRACRKMHITPETKDELDERLNKDEASFFADQNQVGT